MQLTFDSESVMEELGLMAFALAVGGFTFFCSFKDFDWFMNNRRAKIFVMILSRNGARWFYMTLGAVFIFAGIAVGASSLIR